MTASDARDLICQTDEVRAKYLRYWREEEALAELAALWGEGVNANGVFTDSPEEVVYDRDGYTARISIGTANGLFAFGCGFMSPTQGYGCAPSIWGELFSTHGGARTAAIEYLLRRLPSPKYPHEEGQRPHLDRMRQAVSDLLRQPSLF